MKILFHYPPRFPFTNFSETFPTKMKPTNERIGEKAKRKSQDCCVTFKLLSLSVLFTFFMLPIYSMSVDNAVKALVSDHLRNSKTFS